MKKRFCLGFVFVGGCLCAQAIDSLAQGMSEISKNGKGTLSKGMAGRPLPKLPQKKEPAVSLPSDYAQKTGLSQRAAFRLTALYGAAGQDILERGFAIKDRHAWDESIKELAAYVKKTKAFTISTAYSKLFNDVIAELQSATADLFNAVQFIHNSQIKSGSVTQANLNFIKQEHDKLKGHEKKLQELKEQLELKKSNDYQSTKDIKATLLMVLEAFESLYKKVLDEIGTLRATVRFKQESQQYGS